MAVRGTPERVFAAFTQEIDRWWQRGPRFRNLPGDRGIICLEPGIDGRVFESITGDGVESVFEIGRITHWEPPHALAFTWRGSNFAAGEITLVSVSFVANGSTTLVTVTHSGWRDIRPDHPARHQQPPRDFLAGLGRWWADQLRSLANR